MPGITAATRSGNRSHSVAPPVIDLEPKIKVETTNRNYAKLPKGFRGEKPHTPRGQKSAREKPPLVKNLEL